LCHQIPTNEADPTSTDTRTVTFREWLTGGRAQRRMWRSLRRTPMSIDFTARDARPAAKAENAASHKGQAKGLGYPGG
jgi:hypothetical protein